MLTLKLKYFMILQLQKKRKVENYQNPSASREYTGLYRWHGVGRAVTVEKVGGRAPCPAADSAPPRALLN